MQPAQKTMGVSSRSRERPYNIVTGESIDPELTWAPGGARVRTAIMDSVFKIPKSLTLYVLNMVITEIVGTTTRFVCSVSFGSRTSL